MRASRTALCSARPLARHSLLLAALVVGSGACARSAPVGITLVEPCDQKNVALAGVASYVVSSSGSEVDGTTAFSKDQGPAPLEVGLTKDGSAGVIVSVKAFAEDVSASPASTAVPKSVGHSMPLPITAETQKVEALIPVGASDSFGRTTNAKGECTEMTPDEPVRGRHAHTATFVPGLNQVLIYGGAVWGNDGTEQILPGSAELWDPATGEFTKVDGATSRAYHAATALPDGRVVVSGGFGVISGSVVTLQTADIFDPASRTFRTIQLRQARAHHTSTLMAAPGLLALVGGCVGAGPNDACTPTQAGAGGGRVSTDLAVTIETLDVSDPAASMIAVPADQGLTRGRAFHQATSLENGSNTLLVVTGGANKDGTVADIEVFRVEQGVLTRLPAALGNLANFPTGKAPARHQAVAISPLEILILGGQTQAPGGVPSGVGSTDVFLFATSGGIRPERVATLVNEAGRFGHQAARLGDGVSILVVGGSAAADAPTVEMLGPEPGTGVLKSRVVAGPLVASRDRGALAVLPNNQVLFTGGHSLAAPLTTSSSAEIFFAP